jgi:Zn finger protein HypA/HybF involved in hydrogenase expression
MEKEFNEKEEINLDIIEKLLLNIEIQDPYIICCNCNLIKIHKAWISISVEDKQKLYDTKKLSHGYCPCCHKKALDEIRKLKLQLGASQKRRIPKQEFMIPSCWENEEKPDFS